MSPQKLSAIIVIAGSILFLIAAFSPISRVYATPTASDRLELINLSPRAWIVSQVLFALGAIVPRQVLHLRPTPSGKGHRRA